jgi:polar amino acid transport system substrate-binding protein
MKQITKRKILLVALPIGLLSVVGSELVLAMGNGEPKLQIAAAENDAAAPAVEATPAPAPAVKVPSSNPLSGDPEAIDLGKRLYFTWCVQCHGPKANGESRFGKYAGNLTIFWRGYKEFVVIVKNGRPSKQMPPWKEVLDDDNIAKIGAYLETRALEGANWK